METPRPIKPLTDEFARELMMKETELVSLFIHLRNYLLKIAPDSHELVYNTHALTSVFSHSKKLSHAFCHIPIYTSHLNLGFNKGTLLTDPNEKLVGTGKLIRHLPIKAISDFDDGYVKKLIEESIQLSKPE